MLINFPIVIHLSLTLYLLSISQVLLFSLFQNLNTLELPYHLHYPDLNTYLLSAPSLAVFWASSIASFSTTLTPKLFFNFIHP